MTHMLHGADIFSSMYPNNGPNVGKYSMEHMGLIIEYGNNGNLTYQPIRTESSGQSPWNSSYSYFISHLMVNDG